MNCYVCSEPLTREMEIDLGLCVNCQEDEAEEEEENGN